MDNDASAIKSRSKRGVPEDPVATPLGEFLALLPLSDQKVLAADELLVRVRLPLRTVDALHLAAAVSQRVADMATADRVFAAAAGSIGLTVSYFGSS